MTRRAHRPRAGRGWPRRRWAGLLILCRAASVVGASGCGYHAVYGGDSPARLHVALSRTVVPDAVASDEVLSGLREELAREGALASGQGWPRVEVEVLRAGGSSEGVRVRAGSAGSAEAPEARGVEVGIVGRAWVVAEPGAPPERDTGDMRSEDVISVDSSGDVLDLRATAFHQADAMRAAARRLGSKLGRKVLGNPVSSEGESR